MNRYRTTFPEDDPSIIDGDANLVGVNLYDNAENLPPGLCQAATNVDFTTQDAVTRGGFVCLPDLGIKAFGDLFWTQQKSAANNQWLGIAYGNNLYVAISIDGSGNRVMTSPDGVAWTIGASAANLEWRSIAYGNGIYVAVASGVSGGVNRVMTSAEGITWTQRSGSADQPWYSVCYGGGLFVAVAGPGASAVMTSPDGITWTSRTPASSASWNSVCYGNGLFVSVSFSGIANNVMTSPDGIAWTIHAGASVNQWSSVCYGGGLYVAVSIDGAGNRVMTSPDGATWTSRTSAANNQWLSVVYGNGTYVAVANTGTGNRVMSSTNGVSWSSYAGIPDVSWNSVTYGNSFVAVGSSSAFNAVMTGRRMIFASGRYSDPQATDNPWIVLAGTLSAGFFSFGQTSRSVNYPAGFTITEQSCIVQANNFLFIFGGPDKTPIYWDGSWGGTFIPVPASTLGVGFMSIPQSNSALYYQNRLWVVDGKDVYAASQALDFQNFNDLTDVFNLNVGTSDFIVTSYPFGNNSIVVFKNHSSYLLQNVSGDLTDVTSTEITRQLGIVGINAVTAVGPDIVYVSSDRNITSVRLNIQNATQAVTVPISRNINPLMARVNWAYGYKISVGYWNNLLFVAMPFDNATVCNTVLVYNFITNQWYGEWNFDSSINVAIQGWVTANYLGQIRMHAITEDGRIFVVNEGQNDISGTAVSDIASSVTTRAYPMNNDNRFNRRMWADLQTNRPNFSIRGYVDGVNEYSDLITNQTYLRTQSWLYPTPIYSSDNSSDDFNQAFRKDYSTGPNSIQCGTGFLPEAEQEYRLPLIFRRNGRLVWYRVTNTSGRMTVNGIGGEARAGYRSSLVEVG